MLKQYEREITYAFQILSALEDGKLHKGADVCSTQKCPCAWGYKIAKKLETAGFITIKRGRYGGYRLIQSLDDITIKDLVLAIKPNSEFIPFLNRHNTAYSDQPEYSAFLELHKIQEEMWDVLERRSINDIKNSKIK